MMLFFLETLIQISLVGLSLYFLKSGGRPYGYLHYSFFAVGALSAVLLALRFFQFAAKIMKSQRSIKRDLEKSRQNEKQENNEKNRKKSLFSEQAALKNLEFVETAAIAASAPQNDPLGPFEFIRKAPTKFGQSQLQSLDELIFSLPKTYQKALVVSQFQFKKDEGTLIEALTHERNFELVICREIYSGIDLVPDFGPSEGLSLMVQKRLGDVLRHWVRQYDRIIFFMDEGELDKMKSLSRRSLAYGESVSNTSAEKNSTEKWTDKSTAQTSSVQKATAQALSAKSFVNRSAEKTAKSRQQSKTDQPLGL